jgi:hypothetical protein
MWLKERKIMINLEENKRSIDKLKKRLTEIGDSL